MKARLALPRAALLVVAAILASLTVPTSAEAQVNVPSAEERCTRHRPTGGCENRAPVRTYNMYTSAENDVQRAQMAARFDARIDSLAVAAEKRENDREERLKIEVKQSLDGIPNRLLREEMVRLMREELAAELTARIRALEAQVEELRRRGAQ